MDNKLEEILEDLQESVKFSIQMYKLKDDIEFIKIAIESLDSVLNILKDGDSDKKIPNEFLMPILGMKDELNVIVENHRKS